MTFRAHRLVKVVVCMLIIASGMARAQQAPLRLPSDQTQPTHRPKPTRRTSTTASSAQGPIGQVLSSQSCPRLVPAQGPCPGNPSLADQPDVTLRHSCTFCWYYATQPGETTVLVGLIDPWDPNDFYMRQCNGPLAPGAKAYLIQPSAKVKQAGRSPAAQGQPTAGVQGGLPAGCQPFGPNMACPIDTAGIHEEVFCQLQQPPSAKPYVPGKPIEGSCSEFSNEKDTIIDPRHPGVDLKSKMETFELCDEQDALSWKKWHDEFYANIRRSIKGVLERYSNEEQLPQKIEVEYTVLRPSPTTPSWYGNIKIISFVKEPPGVDTPFDATIRMEIQKLNVNPFPEGSKRMSVQMHATLRINYGKRGATQGAPPPPEVLPPR